MSYCREFYGLLNDHLIAVATVEAFMNEERYRELFNTFLDWTQQTGQEWKIPTMRYIKIFRPEMRQIKEDWPPPMARMVQILKGVALRQGPDVRRVIRNPYDAVDGKRVIRIRVEENPK